MVLVSRAEKRAIHAYLLREGVIVVRKDSYLPQHQHIENVSNLKVQMIVKSLKSHGYLQEIYNWQWSYYLVTNRGVTFLAKALGKYPHHTTSFSFYSHHTDTVLLFCGWVSDKIPRVTSFV